MLTSSSSCFTLAFCLSMSPSRTRLAALFLSFSITALWPFPSFAPPDNSKTQPARAFRRCAADRLSSVFGEPDSNFVWTRRWRSASFWALELVTSVQSWTWWMSWSTDRSLSTSVSSVSSEFEELGMSRRSFEILDDYCNWLSTRCFRDFTHAHHERFHCGFRWEISNLGVSWEIVENHNLRAGGWAIGSEIIIDT